MSRLAPAVLLVCLLVAVRAHASPLVELTGGIGDQAGFNGRAGGSGAASTYFNPALLPRAKAGFQTGFFILNDLVSISLDGRGAVDVPRSYRGATHSDGRVFEQTSLPTAWLREGCAAPECTPPLPARPRQSAGSSGNVRAYQALGLVAPLIDERLVLGIYGVVPLSTFTTASSFFVDEREQFFTNSLHAELYSDRLTATSFAFGLGSQLLPRLSLGASFTLGLRTSAAASTFVANPDDLNNTLVLSTDVGVETALAPHFGLNYEIVDHLQLSATVHSPQRFDIETGITAFLPNGNKQSAARNAVHDYMPWQIGLGVSCDLLPSEPSSDGKPPPNRHTLSLLGSVVLGLWSGYVDRQGDRPTGRYAWSDTPSVVLGARYGYGRFRSLLDVLYAPSPVPLQTGRTNYVDNDRLSTTAGVDYTFELFGVSWRAGVQGQFHALFDRYQRKLDPLAAGAQGTGALVRDEFPDDAVDTRGQPIAEAQGVQTNNPGAPGFGSRGMLIGGGLTLALLFP